MKKPLFVFLFAVCTLSAISFNSKAANLLTIDSLKICSYHEPVSLFDFILQWHENSIFTGDGVIQVGSKYHFDPKEVLYKGTHSIYFSQEINAQTVIDTLVVMVIEMPKVYAGKYDSVCVDNNIFTLDNESPKGPTGKWHYLGKDKSTWDSIGIIISPLKLDTGTHFFAYTFTVPGTSCSDTAYTHIQVNPLPKPQIFTIWNKHNDTNSICKMDSMLLEGNTKENGESYIDWVWQGNGVKPILGGKFEFNAYKAGIGEHLLTYTVTSILGCANSISQKVVVEDFANLDFEYIRNGNSITFTNLTKNAQYFSWSFGDSSTSNDKSPSHNYAAAGFYMVTLNSIDRKIGEGNSCPDMSFSKEIEIFNTGINLL